MLATVHRLEPRFSATLESGVLLGNATLSDLSWSSPGIEIMIPRLMWSWDLRCLADRTICLDLLQAEGSQVTLIKTVEEAPTTRKSGELNLELPVAIEIRNLQLQQNRIEIGGHVIALDKLQLAGRYAEAELRVSPLQLQGLQVDVASPSSEETPTATAKPDKGEPLKLPEIHLPLALQVEGFELDTARIRHGGSEYLFGRMQLAARAENSEIEISDLQLQQSRVEVDGHVVALDDLQLAARFVDSELQVSPLQLQGLQVDIASPSPEARSAATEESPRDESLVLPEIHLPLPIQLEGFELNSARIRQGEAEYLIDRLQLAARAENSEIELSDVEISTPQAALKLQTEISLTDDYPLSLNAQGKLLDLPPLSGLEARLNATGSIANLSFDLAASGPVTAHLTSNVKLLEPTLPFAADLSWQNFSWPIKKPTMSSDSGQLEINGSLENYSFHLHGDASGEQFPDMLLSAQGQGDLQQLKLDSLTLETLEGKAQLRGSLGWQEQIAWQGHLELQNINPEELLAELSGQLSGQLESEFTLSNGNWDLGLRNIIIDGELSEQALKLKGSVQGSSSGKWQLSQLQLVSGTNQLLVDGEIGEVSNLQGELEIVDLQNSIPQAEGSASGKFSVSGKRDALELEFSLTAAGLAYMDESIETLDADGQLVFAQMPQGSIHIQTGEINYQDFIFEHLKADFSGDSQAHKLSVDLTGEKISVQSRLDGQLVDQLWSGTMEKTTLKTPIGSWFLGNPLELRYDLNQKQAFITKHCWRSESASLCLNEDSRLGTSGQLDISLRDYSSDQLSGIMPDGFIWQGTLSATATAGWSPQQKPQIKADISAGSGQFGIDQGEQRLNGTYQKLELKLSLDEATARAHLALRSDLLGQGDISLQLSPYQEERPLQSEFHLTGFQLSILRPLIAPLEDISGTVDAEGKVSGTLKHPQVDGSVSLRDGRIDSPNLPTDIEQVNLQLKLDNNQGQLDGKLLLGKGPADLTGLVSWAKTPITGWVTLKGQRNRYRIEPELDLLVTPDLRLELHPEHLSLTGKLLIPYGRAKIKSLPQGTVRLSEDVTILDNPDAQKVKEPLPFIMDIEVTLQDDVKIEAFGLKADLQGSLALKKSANQPLIGNGSIDLEEGTYRAFGQNLQINKGVLLFAGTLSKPYIDVNAIRNPEITSDDVIAGIRLQGEAQKPKVTIYSEPPLPQQQAISYLLRGRSLDTSSETSQDTMVATMLIGAGIGRSEGTIDELGNVFGVRDMAVDTRGEGEDTKVNVSGYVMPGVQVGYGVGVFSPVTEVTLRYEILPNLVLVAVNGLQSALDIFYEFEF